MALLQTSLRRPLPRMLRSLSGFRIPKAGHSEIMIGQYNLHVPTFACMQTNYIALRTHGLAKHASVLREAMLLLFEPREQQSTFAAQSTQTFFEAMSR